MNRWCDENGESIPIVLADWVSPPEFGTCAYYRDSVIYIHPKHCAAIGTAGRQWSYPGYSVDRTPYGVIQHELGHHIDKAHGPRGGIYGVDWHRQTGEKPLTGYCPNDNEWFAEMFRLFVTNPDLLCHLRPLTWTKMMEHWKPVERRTWSEVLHEATRQRVVIEKRIHAKI